MAQSIRWGTAVLRASVIAALALVGLHAVAADRTASLQPEQVRIVQRSLQDWGYPVALSGTWDDSTRAAISSFQKSNELPATGTLDSATSEALGVDPTAVVPVAGRVRGTADRRADPAADCSINITVDCLPGQ